MRIVVDRSPKQDRDYILAEWTNERLRFYASQQVDIVIHIYSWLYDIYLTPVPAQQLRDLLQTQWTWSSSLRFTQGTNYQNIWFPTDEKEIEAWGINADNELKTFKTTMEWIQSQIKQELATVSIDHK
jgi:hypothetical protein